MAEESYCFELGVQYSDCDIRTLLSWFGAAECVGSILDSCIRSKYIKHELVIMQ